MAALTSEQLDELQSFIKDWLRQSGRTQSDLRRALRASSIRMPVLLDELDRTYRRDGLVGLAERLCDIEAVWQSEDQGDVGPTETSPAVEDSLGQLDLLLEEIRLEVGDG